MSEVYLVPGNDWYALGGYNHLSQSFVPQETFALHYLDVDALFKTPWSFPRAHIKRAFGDGKPYGDALASSKLQAYVPTDGTGRYRTRLFFDPFTLEAGDSYAIELSSPFDPWPASAKIRFVKEGGAYPHGNKCHSSDGGNTWTTDWKDDVIFGVFGSPPVPEPPPKPPVRNFAVLILEQTVTTTGYAITAATNVPVHLYLYWTNKEPEKHVTVGGRRGDLSMRSTRFCFVNWHRVEQLEAGDTIYHHFIIEPWPECETRWFTFKGEVETFYVASVGPIFKKHRSVTPLQATFYPDPHPEVTSVDGWLRKYHVGTWAEVTSGDATEGDDWTTGRPIVISSAPGANQWDECARLYFLYDTSFLLPEYKILSAYLRFFTGTKIDNLNIRPNINVFSANPLSNTQIVFADFSRVGSIPFSTAIPFDWLPVWGPIYFHLNPAGLAAINKGGITKFSLRNGNYDAAGMAPPWTSSQSSMMGIGLADGAEPAERPSLVVTYQLA